MGVIATDILLT